MVGPHSGSIKEVNPPDEEYKTPLHYSAMKGHVEVCQLILDHVVDRNPCDKDGRSPLALARQMGLSRSVVQHLESIWVLFR